MTPQEFKAWFEGFTEAFNGVPTKAQWARVKERVAEIDGKPVTQHHYIDRYWPSYPNYYWRNPGWTYLSACGNASGIGQATAAYNVGGTTPVGKETTSLSQQYHEAFNSLDAMNALGKADARALAA